MRGVFCILLSLVALLFGVGPLQGQATPATAPALSGRLGAPIQLFNGKDLAGWIWFQQPPAVPMAEVWTVNNGILHCKGAPTGYIRTEKAYDNYVLTTEQRHVNRGNGGILFAMSGEDKIWPKSLEAQGQSDNEGHLRGVTDFKLNMDPARSVPRQLNRIGPPSAKPMGEWDTVVVTVDHGTVVVTVNGQLQNFVTSNESLAGKIGLQAEGGEMEFRKIELRPIEGGTAERSMTPLFNGKNLSGWKMPADPTSWKVVDGVLIGEAEAGREGNNLMTETSYQDVEFETEFRHAGQSDSGVYLRQPQAELQIGISSSLKTDKTASLFQPGQGGGYVGNATVPEGLIKKGEWNKLRFIAKGDNLKVWLNGQQVLDYDIAKYAGAAPLALQLHAGPNNRIEYRNMNVREMK